MSQVAQRAVIWTDGVRNIQIRPECCGASYYVAHHQSVARPPRYGEGGLSQSFCYNSLSRRVFAVLNSVPPLLINHLPLS